MSESSPEVIKNLVFLGTLGSGKTSICNTITGVPNKLFGANPDQNPLTTDVIHQVCESKRLRLFDTPTLESNILSGENIEQTNKWLLSAFSDWKDDNSGQIDAFLLTVKLNPRAQTLKADLKKIRDLFGTVAFKSLILVPVYHEENYPNRKEFLQALKKMDEVVEILKDGKEEEPNENWFCVWNNLHPNKDQEKELLTKISKLEPYTTQKFIGSSEEIKRRLSKRLEKEFQQETKNLQTNLDPIIQEYNQKKKALLEAHEKAKGGVQELDSMVRNINATTKIALEILYQGAVYEREQLVNKFLEQVEGKHKDYEKKLHRYLKESERALQNFEEEIDKKVFQNDEVQENRKFGHQVKELIFGKHSTKKKEELLEETAKREGKIVAQKGSETATKKGVVEVSKTGAKTLGKRCNIF